MGRFAVGDFVRVADESKLRRCGGVVGRMLKYAGMETVITGYFNLGDSYYLRDCGGYVWESDALILSDGSSRDGLVFKC